ncbi:glycohydrolase toxin TNT-related protein [Microterricola viridarii]|uniref:TNT domain-containing protein n=1 Tax=Microterricola viridarii TaxID=412690 RepID=A0A1H1NLU8_9MICO|nr:glycohydrolase toxin TNT-related protein [Microterricola viridarii]SDR99962.1 Protein of unknown function [Microterricola viridarii]
MHQRDGGGGSKNVSRSDGLIIPDKIPGDDLSPTGIRTSATAMRTAATTLRTQSTSIDSTWAALPASFVAPDAGVLYAAMGPASTKARDFAGKLTRVSAALDVFADAVEPIKKTLATIKADAITFTNEIGQDGLVWINARATKAYEWDSNASYASGSYGYAAGYSYGATSTGGATTTVQDPVSYLRGRGESARNHGGVVQILASWTESGHHVNANNDLLDRVADAYAKVNAAEVECANTINRERDICAAPLVAVEAWQLKQEGDSVAELPWGHRVEQDRNCGENFGNGIVIGAKGTVEGLGSLISYNPLKGEWGDWEHAGQAWTATGTALGSLALNLAPGAPLLAALGVPVFVDARDTSVEMLKGLVAWDTWADNPSEAAGQVLFNVGSIFIPVGGVVAGATKVIGGAAKAGSLVSKVVTKIETAVVHIGDAFTNTLERVKNLLGKGELHIPKDLFEKPPISKIDADAPAVHKVDTDGGLHGSRADTDSGAPAHKADGDTPAHKGDDGAPGHRADSDTAVGGKGDGDSVAPVKGDGTPEAPGSSKPDVDTATPPKGDGDTKPVTGDKTVDPATPAPKVHHESVDGSAPAGDGWTRTSEAEEQAMDAAAKAKRDGELQAAGLAPDAPYGEVQVNSLTEAPLPPKPADVTGTGYSTVSDSAAPWGRDSSGTPFTEQEYASRFTQTGKYDIRYPDSAGVEHGTRVTYTDPAAYIRDFGTELDRVGPMSGKYFGVVEDGVAASFEQRGLPLSNLAADYYGVSFTERAAEIMKANGIHVEISRIAPAFGREGGALQTRFIDGNGNVFTGEQLASGEFGLGVLH